MRSNAENTFIYVSILWKDLARMTSGVDVLEQLSSLKSRVHSNELYHLYDLMFEWLKKAEDEYGKLYLQGILYTVILVSRPLKLQELAMAAGLPGRFLDYSDEHGGQYKVGEFVEKCGHFLTIRDGKVYLVHQSVKDYLMRPEASDDLSVPRAWVSAGHAAIARRCLTSLSSTLSFRNLSNLDALTNRKPSEQELATLGALSYACCYWTEHVIQADDQFVDEALVITFFQDSYLPWLEAMGNLGFILQCAQMIWDLKIRWHQSTRPRESDNGLLLAILNDSLRFLDRYQGILKDDPSQAYFLAMFFTSPDSLTRRHCQRHFSSCVRVAYEL